MKPTLMDVLPTLNAITDGIDKYGSAYLNGDFHRDQVGIGRRVYQRVTNVMKRITDRWSKLRLTYSDKKLTVELHGVCEVENEDLEEISIKIAAAIGVKLGPEAIIGINRVKKSEENPKPIVIHVTKQKSKEFAEQKKMQITGVIEMYNRSYSVCFMKGNFFRDYYKKLFHEEY